MKIKHSFSRHIHLIIYLLSSILYFNAQAQIWDADDLRPEANCSGTLPILHINVFSDESLTTPDNDILSRNIGHKEFFRGNYWLETNNCRWLEELGAQNIGSSSNPLPLQIKLRGNFTRKAFSKKPFKLKLDKKQRLLGLTKSKHFVLLAHADDIFSYLCNFSGLNLGKRIGLPWTPEQQPVEVYINNDYRGLYFLTESIRIDPERIDIEEQNDYETDRELITGGYIVEITNRWEDNQIHMKEKSFVDPGMDRWLCISPKSPEFYSAEQEEFVSSQFSAMNDAVGECSDKLWDYIDIDDAARYYLVMEIISQLEAYSGSTYLFRNRGNQEKWHFTPVWDCGNAFQIVNQHFFNTGIFNNHWIESMIRNKRFLEKIKDTWLQFMSSDFNGFYADINAYIGHIAEAAKSDAQRWKDVPMPDGYDFAVSDNSDITEGRDVVIESIERKINWMKKIYGNYSSIDLVEVENNDPVIFDLQGRRIETPVRGRIYIRNGALYRFTN